MARGSRTVGVDGGSARLVVVFVAAMVPVLAAVAVGRLWPVFVAVFGVLMGAVVLGRLRGATISLRDATLVVIVAALTALLQPVLGAWTLAGGLCAASLLAARGMAMPWVSWSRGRWWVGYLVASLVGGLLGLVNVFGARSSGDADRVGASMSGPFDALRAAVSEELGMRLYLLAICIYAIGRLPRTRGEQLLTYLVLTVPHAAVHFIERPDLVVGGTMTLGVVFGLPLAFLLKRFGLGPAVLAHTMIDGVRWAAIGM